MRGRGEGGVETPRPDRASLDAGAAADAARRIGVRFVAAGDGLRGTDRRTAAAAGAEVGIACGQIDDGFFRCRPAVAQHEADEPQHRQQRCPHVFQPGGIDRREVPGGEFFAHRGAERLGLCEVLRIGASRGDGRFGGAVRMLPDESPGGHRDESLPRGSPANSATAFSKARLP